MKSIENQETDPATKRGLGSEFWRFHLIFWSVTTLVMFLAGLSQLKGVEVSSVRNLTYGILGFFTTLLLIPLFDHSRLQSTQRLLISCLAGSYLLGTSVTLLVNPISALQSGMLLADYPWQRWFSGSLNFSLTILVWSGLYLALKLGLHFVKGKEAQKAAEAISSISSLSNYPGFMALERNKRIILLPVGSISAVQGAGDYVEISTDEGDFLKRASLNSMVELLDPDMFQRVHRSAIVNISAIRELEPKGKGDFTIILESGAKIASSRSYMKDFKTRFPGIL